LANSVGSINLDLGLNTKDFEKQTSSVAQLAKNGISTAFAGVGAVVASSTAAITAMGSSVVNATSDVAEFGDTIDKESQKLGISAEAYQEWDAVLQHTGGSIDNLKPALKTLSKEIVNNSGAFQELGLSQEEVLNSSVEDVLSMTISKLQEMEPGIERTRLATQLLGKSSVELGALLNTSAEETQAMKDRLHELGGVMSNDAVKNSAAFEDSLQDMQTAIDSISRNIMAEFMPSLTSIMNGITDIVSGNPDEGLKKISEGINSFISNITNNLPKLFEIGSGILTAIGDAIIQNLPTLLESGMEILNSLTTSIINALPVIVETALTIITTLAQGIGEALPELIPTIVEVMLQIVEVLIDNIDALVDAAIAIILGLAEGIINALPVLLEKAPVIIQKLVDAIIRNLPKLIEAAIQLIMMLTNMIIENLPILIKATIQIVGALVSALIDNAPMLIQSAIELIAALVGALIDLLPEIMSFGKQLLDELWEALTNGDAIQKLNKMGWEIIDKVAKGIADTIMIAKDWGKDLLDNFIKGIKEKWEKLKTTVKQTAESIKKFLGFSEPEEGPLSNFHTFAPDMMKLFAKGIKDNTDLITDQLQDSFNFKGVIQSPALSMIKTGQQASNLIQTQQTQSQIADADLINMLLKKIDSIKQNNNDKPIEITLEVGGVKFGKAVINSINKAQNQAGKILLQL
jgi:phage-related protein